MTGITADVIKMGAGVFIGLFVLIIVYGMAASLGNTACWRNTVKDFSNKLTGYDVNGLQSELGTKNEFYVNLPIADCLNGIWFVDENNPAECDKACEEYGGSSSVVKNCKKDCFKKCGLEKGDCIVLIPVRTGNEAPWYKGYQWAAFWVANTPAVFSSNKYSFDFSGLEKITIDWDWGDDEMIIIKNGKESEITFDNNLDRCLVFSSNDKIDYNVLLLEECPDDES